MTTFMTKITRSVIKHIVAPQLTGTSSVKRQRLTVELAQGLMPIASGVKREDIKLKHCKLIKLANKKPQASKNNNEEGAILYLHGGAYVTGSANTHKEFASILAKQTGNTVYLLDYRLAPENPHPAALEDAVEAIEYIHQHHTNVALCGDSAGGGLSLATAQYLRDNNLKQTVALGLISPWVNLLCNNESFETKKNIDPLITQEWLAISADRYAGGNERDAKYISPALHEMNDLPATLIQVGSDEVLLDDSLQLNDKMIEAGVNVELKVFQDMWHIFQLQGTLVKQGKVATQKLAEFLARELEK